MKGRANSQGLGFCAQEWGCRGNRGPLDETSWTEAAFSPISVGQAVTGVCGWQTGRRTGTQCGGFQYIPSQ